MLPFASYLASRILCTFLRKEDCLGFAPSPAGLASFLWPPPPCTVTTTLGASVPYSPLLYFFSISFSLSSGSGSGWAVSSCITCLRESMCSSFSRTVISASSSWPLSL